MLLLKKNKNTRQEMTFYTKKETLFLGQKSKLQATISSQKEEDNIVAFITISFNERLNCCCPLVFRRDAFELHEIAVFSTHFTSRKSLKLGK